MSDEMVFEDITPQEVPVRYGTERYILREAMEEDVVWWQGEQFRGARVSKDSRSVTNLQGMMQRQSMLLSRCLYRARDDGTLPLDSRGDPDRSQLVPEPTIRKWKARAVKELFKRLTLISGIDEDEKPEGGADEQASHLPGESSKNSHASTTTSSA